MTESRLSQPVGRVSTLPRADNATSAPRVRTCDERASKQLEVVRFERETTQRVASERIETGGDQKQLRHEALSRCVDAALKCLNVVGARQAGRLRNVPDRTV